MVRERLRMGMIGCGDAGRRAAQGITDAEHAELAGVMDVDEGLVRDLATDFGVAWTCDVAELLARPGAGDCAKQLGHWLRARGSRRQLHPCARNLALGFLCGRASRVGHLLDSERRP